MNPTVSILVPTYNRSRLLKIAVESILTQTFTDYEIIISDNASSDNTTEVVNNFKDGRIRYVRNPVNVGAVNNYNRALHLATGRYVYIFSDDDVMLPDNLACKVKVLDEYPGVGLVHSNVELINGQGLVTNKTRNEGFNIRFWNEMVAEPLMLSKRAYHILYYEWDFIYMPSVMVRKSVLENAKMEFNNQLNYMIDWDLWMKIARESDFYFLEEPLMQYRFHDSNATLGFSAVHERIHFHELMISKLSQLNPKETVGSFDDAVAQVLSSIHAQHLFTSTALPTRSDFVRLYAKRLVPHGLKQGLKKLIGRK